MPSIRIVISSDNPIMRSALAALLDRVDDFEIAAEICLSSLTGFSRRSSDVLLLEVTESHVGRLGKISNNGNFPGTHAVVLVDSDPKATYIRSLFTLGAKAYVLKSSDTDDLYKAIRLAHRDRLYLDPQLGIPIAKDLLNGQGLVIENVASQLSSRETQVIREVARGFTSRAIARKLGVSQKTIQTYRARIYEKLGFRTRAEVVQYAIRNGLLLGVDAGQRSPFCGPRNDLSARILLKRKIA